MPANDLGLVSGSQTYTGQIGTGNPDTLYNLTGNADLLLKTSSGTILDISTTIGTIPDEINVSELAAEDNSLLVLSPGGDTDYNPSQKLGEVANSEKLVVDPLTGSNSEPPTTTITSNNPSEKSKDSTDLITGDPVENQDATAPSNSLTGTTDDTNSTDKITETDSEIGITSATEKSLGETVASPDKSSNEITNLETKSSPEKPITSDSESTDSSTGIFTTESPDKSTNSAASEITSETTNSAASEITSESTNSPETTISNSVESAAASNTQNTLLSNGETNKESTIDPLTGTATLSETGAEFKEIATSPNQLTNSVESTGTPELVTGEFVENSTEKSANNTQLKTLSNAENSQEETLTLSSEETTTLTEVKPLPTSEDKPETQLEKKPETVVSNGTNSKELTGSIAEKKPEENSIGSANNNQSLTAILPDENQDVLAKEETKAENTVVENSTIIDPKETVIGDNLTTEKPVNKSSEINDTSTEKTPVVSSTEKDHNTDAGAEAFTTEIQKELNPATTELEPIVSPKPFTYGTLKVDYTGQIGIDFLFDGGMYQGQLAIFSLKGMAIFVPGSEAFIKEATARALSNSVQGHVVISDLSEGARFSGKLGEENFNSGGYLGVKTFDMTPGDELGIMIVPHGTVQEVFDNPAIGGNKRPLFSMATANPENGMQIGQIADVTGEGNTFSMEDLRIDGWTDRDYNDFVFQVRGAVGKAVLMDDVVAAGKDWRTSDLGKALVDYAKAYITPELVDDQADIAPTDNTSTMGVTDPLSEDETNNNSTTPTTGVTDTLSEDETSNNNNTLTTGVTDTLSEDETNNNSTTPTTGVTNPISEDETNNNNNTPTTGVTNPISEDETSNNSNTSTTGLAESTDETQTGNDSVIGNTNLTDNNSAIVEKEIPTVTEPVLSNVTNSVDASVGLTGTPTVTNTTATTPDADVSLKPVAPTTTTDIVTGNKPVAPATTTDIVTGNKPVTPATTTDIVTGNKPVTPAVGSTVVKTGETSNVVTSTVPKVAPTNTTQTTTTVNSQVTPANVGSNIAPTVASTAVTTAPTYNFPPADQPLVSAINKELLSSSGNWTQSLIEFVDNAKISPQPNAVVNINLDLTQILPDGSVAPRYELTSKEEEAIAYAQKHNILVVVPVGDHPAQVSALGQLSKQYDNIIAVGAAKRVNDAIAPSKAFAPAPDSGRGEALNILADVSGEGSGTSLAAAKVTDAVSSVWAANPKLNYTQVIDLLKRTATDLGKPNWDVDTGAGLLNVAAAVNLAKATQPEPYTVKPGQQTITDNFISQNNAAKVLPGIPTHPAVTPPGVPQTAADQGANNLSGTPIQISSTQDVIDQVSAIDPADVYRVESRYLAGSEFSVLSGQLSVSFVTPTGQVLGSQVFAAGNHTLQLPGGVPNEVLVKIDSQGGAPATYRLKGFESQAPEPFNIDLEFVGGLTASQQAIMQAAAKSVASLIGKGLPSAIVDGKIIDDINIKVSTANIDGGNGTQAQTKIDFMRYGTLLPAQSITQFDAADIGKLESSGELFSVAQHEFLHALGFGNLWEAKGLVDYAGTPLAQFNGQNSVAAFKDLGGLTDAISLETEGKGSAGLHWHEALFQDDVMTADLNFSGKGGNAPISTVTIASLADLGYQVNLERATPDFGLFGGQRFNANDLTLEQIEAFRELAETSFEEPGAEYIAPIMPTVDPDKVSPEIWAHAERFWKNGEYYDWVPYQIPSGVFISHITEQTMGNGVDPDYWAFVGNKNGLANVHRIAAGDWIYIPQHHPDYERKQEQERLQREAELRQRQEEEARIRREQEEAFARDQERVRQEEEARRREAEAKQRELEEQERRLREEMERRRQEEERRLEEARLAELARQAEIARQQGKGGLDWYVAKPLPEFGPVDPFETSLTGETVGNLVPDDYYRFTLSRGGRITAELKKLLADADLVLYDVRNEPIAYSMREGITDEQIIADLIPGTYMLRVNSPKGVTTDYELIVKFKHKLSQSELGLPGWKPGISGNNGGGASGPLFSDPRIQQIYDTALANFAGPERAKANAEIAELEREKRSYEQQMQDLLDQMNAEQRQKVHQALDDARYNANVWVDGIANPIKGEVDNLANGIINKANSLANSLENTVNQVPDLGIDWVKDRKNDAKWLIRQGRDAVTSAVNSARSWLKGKLIEIQDGVNSAIQQFFDTIKNAYRTGAEINQIIANAAQTFRNAVDLAVRGANNLIGEFKGRVLSAANWTKDLGINVDKFGIKFNFNVYNNIVTPAVDAVADGFQSTISGIGSGLKGIVDWIEPRTQKTVADIVNAILGDKTGHLWNQINGVDAKIAATRTGVEKAIASAAQRILSIARQIEALLTDPEEKKRVLDALFRRGYRTAEEAYNFAKEELPKVRDKIAQEAKEAFEKAKKAFADTVRALAEQVLGNSSKRELEANLRLDKIIYGADIRGGYKFELAKDENSLYSVTTRPSIGIGLSRVLESSFEAGYQFGSSFEAGYQSGNVKIAGQTLETEVGGRLEGDLVLDTKIKYVFNYHSDEDMARLGVWAFKEIPTPFDSVDPLLNLLITQNYDSTEVSLNPYLTGELSSPWSVGQIDLSAINAEGIKANGNYYRKVGLAFNADGGYVFDGLVQVRSDLGGKLVFTSESSLNKLESLELEIETTPYAAGLLANKLGINGIENKIDAFNAAVKSEGKAVSNVKFQIQLTDPMKVLSSYSSLAEKIIELSQSKGNVNETINSLLQAVYQTNQAISYKVEAEATQSLYINAEAGIQVEGKIGLKDTSAQEKVLYQK